MVVVMAMAIAAIPPPSVEVIGRCWLYWCTLSLRLWKGAGMQTADGCSMVSGQGLQGCGLRATKMQNTLIYGFTDFVGLRRQGGRDRRGSTNCYRRLLEVREALFCVRGTAGGESRSTTVA